MTLHDYLSAWTFSPGGTLGALLLATAYVIAWIRTPRAERPAIWRLVCYLLLGPLALLVAADSFLGAWREESFMAAAAQSAVLAAVVPVGLAMGDPLALGALSSRTRTGRAVRAAMSSWAGRALFLPLLSSVLAALIHLMMFTTGWLAASVDSAWIRELTYLVLVASGLLVTVPLVASEEQGPVWLSDPVKAFVAFMETAVDAAPAIVVMTAPHMLGTVVPAYTTGPRPLHDYQMGGGAMLGIAEAVGVPLLMATIVQWAASDRKEAVRVDAQAPVEDSFVLDDAAPWWEQDPRLAQRYARSGGEAGSENEVPSGTEESSSPN